MQVEEHILDRARPNSKTYRIIPSKYPSIKLFENCANPDDLESLYVLESLTNSRLKQEAGELSLVPPEDRISGEGTSVILAAFTHTGIASRFTDGSYGVYYAGIDLNTAIAESKHWQEQEMAHLEDQPPFTRTMRVYVSQINSDLSDLVDLRTDIRVQDPDNYGVSQSIARDIRDKDEYGFLYSSVREKGGECLAALRPPIMKPAIQSMHLRYHWNGSEINHIEKVSDVP